MSIGSNIKKLRCERKITQEQLAEYLHLSPSAVSQWETDRVLPDVMQIPLLSRIFGVSADVILGIDLGSAEEKITRVLDEAEKLHNDARFFEAVQLLDGALRENPNSHRLMCMLADSMLNSYIRGTGVKSCDDVITLCDRVIEEASNMTLRNRAVTTLCCAYRHTGQTDELIKAADKMPHVWESREDLLLWNTKNETSLENDREYLDFCVVRTMQLLDKIACAKNETGDRVHSKEERIRMYSQVIAILKTVYCDGDYYFKAQYGAVACDRLVRLYLECGDIEEAIRWIEEESEFDIHFDTYDTSANHTSPAVKGSLAGGWIMEDVNRTGATLEELESDSVFACLKGNPRFEAVTEKLKKYAKRRDN